MPGRYPTSPYRRRPLPSGRVPSTRDLAWTPERRRRYVTVQRASPPRTRTGRVSTALARRPATSMRGRGFRRVNPTW